MRSLGPATVAWSVAIIRDAPRTGAIVGRLVQGTAVAQRLLSMFVRARTPKSDRRGWPFTR